MKKSKKLGLQSLALVLMSLVLVAGVAFGMTGAWFKDSKLAGDKAVTMGKPVYIELKNAEADGAYTGITAAETVDLGAVMPGDEVDFSGLSVIAKANSSKMYVIINVGFVDTNTEDALDMTAIFNGVELKGNWTPLATAGWYFQAVDEDVQDQDLLVYEAKTWNVSTELENEYALKSVSLTVNAYAIQQANVNISATSTSSDILGYFPAEGE